MCVAILVGFFLCTVDIEGVVPYPAIIAPPTAFIAIAGYIILGFIFSTWILHVISERDGMYNIIIIFMCFNTSIYVHVCLRDSVNIARVVHALAFQSTKEHINHQTQSQELI